MVKTKQAVVTAEASDAVLTIPNVITFIRLCMIPAFFVFLLKGEDIIATILFATAAATDFIDGQIARRTNCVTKLGQLLDPFVDRCLMIFGVLGLLIVGRLPIWIVALVVARDLLLLVGGTYLLQRYKRRVPVIFAGKFATTLLFIGFAGLILNLPQVGGLGLVSAAWLPAFNAAPCCWSFWLIYAGLVITVFTTTHYLVKAWEEMQDAKRIEREALAKAGR